MCSLLPLYLACVVRWPGINMCARAECLWDAQTGPATAAAAAAAAATDSAAAEELHVLRRRLEAAEMALTTGRLPSSLSLVCVCVCVCVCLYRVVRVFGLVGVLAGVWSSAGLGVCSCARSPKMPNTRR